MTVGRRALVLGAASACIAAKRSPPTVGQAAPPFDVFTFDWKKIRFDELRGQVVLLNFWASWCAPCLIELPTLDAYFRKHAAAAFRIFAVRSDDNKPNQAFIDLSKRLAFPLVWHLDGGAGYGPIQGKVPTNYVIDAGGVLRYAEPGGFTEGLLDNVVTPLLKAAGPAATSA